MLSSELGAAAAELIGRYPLRRSALLPLLHLVQSQDGYVGDDGIAECADLLALTRAEVRAVATFYSMYKRAPMGRHLVSVCTNVSCMVRGGQEVYDRLSAKLGVGHNETTADAVFTLEHAECLGNCEGAPVVTVDYLNYESVSPDHAEELVDRLAAREAPPPTRGMPPPGVRAVEYHLAGLGPRDPAQPGAATDQARQPLTVTGPGGRTMLPARVTAAVTAGCVVLPRNSTDQPTSCLSRTDTPSDRPLRVRLERHDDQTASDRPLPGEAARGHGARQARTP